MSSDTYAQRPFKSLETFNHDGVVLARVVPTSKRRVWPVRQVMLLLLAVVSFKVFLYLDMGGAAYGAKFDEFAQGGVFQQAAAWAMQMDPVSQWLVDGIRYGRW